MMRKLRKIRRSPNLKSRWNALFSMKIKTRRIMSFRVERTTWWWRVWSKYLSISTCQSSLEKLWKWTWWASIRARFYFLLSWLASLKIGEANWMENLTVQRVKLRKLLTGFKSSNGILTGVFWLSKAFHMKWGASSIYREVNGDENWEKLTLNAWKASWFMWCEMCDLHMAKTHANIVF